MDSGERPESNHFVELVFAETGAPEPLVQYQWGILNFAGLSSVQKATAVDFIEDHELKLSSEGDKYVTVEDVPTEDPAELAAMLEAALQEIYETALSDVETVREREL
ncbi:hypothetical protein ACFQFH_01255 [Halobaculum halobium]